MTGRIKCDNYICSLLLLLSILFLISSVLSFMDRSQTQMHDTLFKTKKRSSACLLKNSEYLPLMLLFQLQECHPWSNVVINHRSRKLGLNTADDEAKKNIKKEKREGEREKGSESGQRIIYPCECVSTSRTQARQVISHKSTRNKLASSSSFLSFFLFWQNALTRTAAAKAADWLSRQKKP